MDKKYNVVFLDFDGCWTTVVNNIISFKGLLFITFLVLKLTGVINWSWIWITAPLWIPFSLEIIFFVIVYVIFMILWIWSNIRWRTYVKIY